MLARVLHPQVYLNGTRLPIKSFADYCDMYLGPKDNGVPRIYERVSDRWEICVSATDGQFQQVSTPSDDGRMLLSSCEQVSTTGAVYATIKTLR